MANKHSNDREVAYKREAETKVELSNPNPNPNMIYDNQNTMIYNAHWGTYYGTRLNKKATKKKSTWGCESQKQLRTKHHEDTRRKTMERSRLVVDVDEGEIRRDTRKKRIIHLYKLLDRKNCIPKEYLGRENSRHARKKSKHEKEILERHQAVEKIHPELPDAGEDEYHHGKITFPLNKELERIISDDEYVRRNIVTVCTSKQGMLCVEFDCVRLFRLLTTLEWYVECRELSMVEEDCRRIIAHAFSTGWEQWIIEGHIYEAVDPILLVVEMMWVEAKVAEQYIDTLYQQRHPASLYLPEQCREQLLELIGKLEVRYNDIRKFSQAIYHFLAEQDRPDDMITFRLPQDIAVNFPPDENLRKLLCVQPGYQVGDLCVTFDGHKFSRVLSNLEEFVEETRLLDIADNCRHLLDMFKRKCTHWEMWGSIKDLLEPALDLLWQMWTGGHVAMTYINELFERNHPASLYISSHTITKLSGLLNRLQECCCLCTTIMAPVKLHRLDGKITFDLPKKLVDEIKQDEKFMTKLLCVQQHGRSGRLCIKYRGKTERLCVTFEGTQLRGVISTLEKLCEERDSIVSKIEEDFCRKLTPSMFQYRDNTFGTLNVDNLPVVFEPLFEPLFEHLGQMELLRFEAKVALEYINKLIKTEHPVSSHLPKNSREQLLEHIEKLDVHIRDILSSVKPLSMVLMARVLLFELDDIQCFTRPIAYDAKIKYGVITILSMLLVEDDDYDRMEEHISISSILDIFADLDMLHERLSEVKAQSIRILAEISQLTLANQKSLQVHPWASRLNSRSKRDMSMLDIELYRTEKVINALTQARSVLHRRSSLWRVGLNLMRRLHIPGLTEAMGMRMKSIPRG